MKSFIEYLTKSSGTWICAALLALAVPFAATPAFAANADAATVEIASVADTVTASTGHKTGLLAEKTSEPETIKVAGRRGAAIAAGILAGAAAAAIVSGAARAHHRRHYDYYDEPVHYRSGYSRRCDRWAYRCECGIRRACRKYYRYCD